MISKSLDKKRTKMLKHIDTLTGYNAKLEYLNGQYLKAGSDAEETMILDLIKRLKFFGF